MSMAAAVMVLVPAAVAGFLAGFAARFLASSALFPDRPNGRSNHRATTSRAGGFAIFGGFAVAIAIHAVWLGAVGGDARHLGLLLLAVAAFSFGAVDDFRPLGARLKLAAQIAIAVGFTISFGSVDRIPAPFIGGLDLGLFAFPLTVFWIVAFMNAFNFMDGVNGIAGACGLFVLCALAMASAGGPWAAPAIFLAAALFGFLPLNLSGGRLFMGDSGSQFVGFTIAALAVLAGETDGTPVSRMFAPIAFLPFIFDVAFTLVHRIRRRRNILEAHKEHVYQLLVRLGRSHQAVTTLYLTLIVLSTTIAMIANQFGADTQYAAALLLALVYFALARGVYRRADAAGLLGDEAKEATIPPAPKLRQYPAAAE